MTPKYINADCRNYAPVDVAKGICHFSKQMVLADAATCEHFNKMPKCKFCRQYSASSEKYLGVCTAESIQPMTYPDLNAVTCQWFSWQEKESL